MLNLLTMTVQLIDRESDGIRICRVEGESLVTVVVPRVKLSEAKHLPDLPHRGIYYLLDEDHGVLNRVYTGQTTQGLLRLEAHKAKKEFWNKAVMFLDDDYNIDRDVLDSLEAMAIEYVRNHGDYETDNTVTPTSRINPYKERRVQELHDSILFRMEALGYDLNRTYSGPSVGSAIFHTKKLGVKAIGRYDKETGKFIVFAGSQIALDKSIIKNRIAITVRAEQFGETTERTTLINDVVFPSPSAAAVFVLGGSQNGWTEWVDDNGNTLSDIYRTEEN